MKSIALLLLGLCCGIAGTVIYFKQQKPAAVAAPTVEARPTPAPAMPETIKVAPTSVPLVAESKPEPPPGLETNAVVSSAESEAAAKFRKTIDTLLSPQLGPRQKHELFEQLRTSNQLDQAIAELKRRAVENTNDAGIPTTLGEAMLNKVRQLHESGADMNEVGILAMQADQSFNAALKIDPSNWEAQFVKYSTMVYWPANEQRDNETAEKLSHLIDQQETMAQQSGFAQTYIALGNQYQKMGKMDFAETTWRLGLSKFPDDPTLKKKVSGR